MIGLNPSLSTSPPKTNRSYPENIVPQNGHNSLPSPPETSASTTGHNGGAKAFFNCSGSSKPDSRAKKIDKFEQTLFSLSSAAAKENQFFNQNPVTLPRETQLGKDGIDSLENTQQLRRCLQSAADKDQPEIKRQLMHLAFQLTTTFKAKNTEALSDLRELIQLIGISDLKLSRQIISIVTAQASFTFSTSLTWGLGLMIKNCPVSLLIDAEKTCDLVQLLRTFQGYLDDFVRQKKFNEASTQVVLQTISHILDAMFVVGITQVQYKQLKEPLDHSLNKLYTATQEKHPTIAWQANYARHVLSHLPSDESKLHEIEHLFIEALLPMTFLITFHASYLWGIGALPSLLKFLKHSIHDGLHGLAHFSALMTEKLPHWLHKLAPRDWYIALRFVDFLIEKDYLALLEKFVRHIPDARNENFLLGLCLRLQQIIASHQTPEVRYAALQFLDDLARNYQQWGNFPKVRAAVTQAFVDLEKMLQAEAQPKVKKFLADLIGKQKNLPVPSPTSSSEFPWNINLELATEESALLGQARKDLLSASNPNDLKDIKSNILALKESYLEELSQSHNSKYAEVKNKYVELEEKSVIDGQLRHYPLQQTINDFLAAPDKRVLILQGEGGSGKTAFCHHLVQQLWDDYGNSAEQDNPPQTQQKRRIPVFIKLPKVGSATESLITKELKRQKFSEIYIDNLKQHHSLVFILDEYQRPPDQVPKLYETAGFAEWQNDTKFIITVRPEVKIEKNLFCSDGQDDSLQTAEIAPFSDSAVETYIEKHAARNPLADGANTYKAALERAPGLSAHKHHPFSLEMALDLLPALNEDEGTSFFRLERYDRFIKNWCHYSHDPLSRHALGDDKKRSLIKRKKNNFDEDLIKFIQNLALDLHQRDALAISPPTTLSENGESVQHLLPSSYNNPADSEKERFTKEQLFILSAPLFKENDTYSLPPSFRDYLISRAICGPTFEFREPVAEALLNRLPLINQSKILTLLAERAKKLLKFKKYLFTWIEASKNKNFQAEHGPANAISILVKAGEVFNGKDLCSISIPEANLEGGSFDGARFDNANLTGVNFSGAWLRGASFNGAEMAQVQFGSTPAISSATGENFIEKMELSYDGRWLASYGPCAILNLHSLTDNNFNSVTIENADSKGRLILSPDKQWAAWQNAKGDIAYRSLLSSIQPNKSTPFTNAWNQPYVFSSDSKYLIVPKIKIQHYDLSKELAELEKEEAKAKSDLKNFKLEPNTIFNRIILSLRKPEEQYMVESGLKINLKKIQQNKENLIEKGKYSIIEIQLLLIQSNTPALPKKEIHIEGEVTAVAFSADRNYLFTAQKESIDAATITIKKWSIQAEKPVESIYPTLPFNRRKGSTEKIAAVSEMVPSPDGQWLALTKVDKQSKEPAKVSLFSLTEFEAKYSVELPFTTPVKLSFSPNGQWLAIIQEEELIVLSTVSGNFQEISKSQENKTSTLIHAVCWQPDTGQQAIEERTHPPRLLTIEGDHVLRTWKIDASALTLEESAPQIGPRFRDISIAKAIGLSEENRTLLLPFCTPKVVSSSHIPSTSAFPSNATMHLS